LLPATTITLLNINSSDNNTGTVAIAAAADADAAADDADAPTATATNATLSFPRLITRADLLIRSPSSQLSSATEARSKNDQVRYRSSPAPSAHHQELLFTLV